MLILKVCVSSFSFSSQGWDSGPAEGAVWSVGEVFPEVPGFEQGWEEQRGEGERRQPQGERDGAAKEREQGEPMAVFLWLPKVITETH